MFVVTVTFEAAPGREDAFLARVRQQAADSLANEVDCHRFDVCTDPARPGRVFLYENYTDWEAFDLHLASPHFRAFDAEAESMIVSKVVEIWELTG